MSDEVKTLEKKVRKKFHKNDVSFADLRRTVAETSRVAAETSRVAAKTSRVAAKTSRIVAETSRVVTETSRKVNKVARMFGNMGNNNGKVAEEFFANALEAKPVFGGEDYDTVLRNLHPARSGKDAEFDVVMINGDKVAIIEVKYCAHPEDLRKLVEQKVSEFRQWFPIYGKHTLYLGIASLSFTDAVLNEAKHLGVGVLRQIGDTLEITAGKLKPF